MASDHTFVSHVTAFAAARQSRDAGMRKDMGQECGQTIKQEEDPENRLYAWVGKNIWYNPSG